MTQEEFEKIKDVPAQAQEHPGLESEMTPEPIYDRLLDEFKGVSVEYKAAGKMKNYVALITGGDSGIGRATAVLFAKEGADVAIVYKDQEQRDAEETRKLVGKEGKRCLCIISDIGREENVIQVVQEVVSVFGHVDVLVNNASEQHVIERIEDLEEAQIERTFKTNIFGMILMAKHALKHMRKGSKIINNASVTAYKGNPVLLDYSSTKGAIVSFTRSLAKQVAKRGIRVNAIAPGPIWTPLIVSSFTGEDAQKWAELGKSLLLGRVGHPVECATCMVFLACSDSSFMTGQVLHPNGGEIFNT